MVWGYHPAETFPNGPPKSNIINGLSLGANFPFLFCYQQIFKRQFFYVFWEYQPPEPPKSHFLQAKFNNLVNWVHVRGGVEDIVLEAKVKDTKKIRGQGQGQTLSRPRTGMLEVKANDQGH